MHIDSHAPSKTRSFCSARGHLLHLGCVPNLSVYNFWLCCASKGLLKVCTGCLRWGLQAEYVFPFQIHRSVVTNTLTVHSLWARLQSQLISSSHYIKKHTNMSQGLIPSGCNSTKRALPHQKIGPCIRPSHSGKFQSENAWDVDCGWIRSQQYGGKCKDVREHWFHHCEVDLTLIQQCSFIQWVTA